MKTSVQFQSYQFLIHRITSTYHQNVHSNIHLIFLLSNADSFQRILLMLLELPSHWSSIGIFYFGSSCNHIHIWDRYCLLFLWQILKLLAGSSSGHRWWRMSICRGWLMLIRYWILVQLLWLPLNKFCSFLYLQYLFR